MVSTLMLFQKSRPRTDLISHFLSYSWLARETATLADAARAEAKVQVWKSNSHNPYLNLSFENELMKKSPEDSAILFLYINSPCVIIGRNQNTWKEVNLTRLAMGLPKAGSRFEKPMLLRRRSGGGTVFHDQGNLNWSIIVPSNGFNRNKHAEMVVRAMRRVGFTNTKVTDRHDIVVQKNEAMGTQGGSAQFKVSGSAYKMTRLRSLHHGTALLNSPNLNAIPDFLHSYAAKYLDARGTESVKSPIANLGLDAQSLVDSIIKEFRSMYGLPSLNGCIADTAMDDPDVASGIAELQDPAWIYNQTPQFTFSTHPDMRDSPEAHPSWLQPPHGFKMSFTVRHGVINECHVTGLADVNILIGELASRTSWFTRNKLRKLQEQNRQKLLKQEEDKSQKVIDEAVVRAKQIDEELGCFLVGTELHTITDWVHKFLEFPAFLRLSNKVIDAGLFLNRVFFNKAATFPTAQRKKYVAGTKAGTMDAFVFCVEKSILRRGNKLLRKTKDEIEFFNMFVRRRIRKTARLVLGRKEVPKNRVPEWLACVEAQEDLLLMIARGFQHQRLWNKDVSSSSEVKITALAWNLMASRLKLEGKTRREISFVEIGERWVPRITDRGGQALAEAPRSRRSALLKYMLSPEADLCGIVPLPPNIEGDPPPFLFWKGALIIMSNWDMAKNFNQKQLVWMMAQGIIPRWDQIMSIPPELEEKRKRQSEPTKPEKRIHSHRIRVIARERGIKFEEASNLYWLEVEANESAKEARKAYWQSLNSKEKLERFLKKARSKINDLKGSFDPDILAETLLLDGASILEKQQQKQERLNRIDGEAKTVNTMLGGTVVFRPNFLKNKDLQHNHDEVDRQHLADTGIYHKRLEFLKGTSPWVDAMENQDKISKDDKTTWKRAPAVLKHHHGTRLLYPMRGIYSSKSLSLKKDGNLDTSSSSSQLINAINTTVAETTERLAAPRHLRNDLRTESKVLLLKKPWHRPGNGKKDGISERLKEWEEEDIETFQKELQAMKRETESLVNDSRHT